VQTISYHAAALGLPYVALKNMLGSDLEEKWGISEEQRKALPILCIALAVLLVLTAVWGWRRGTPVPLADSGLLQTDFTVTGLNFSGISDTELGFQFVPGISGEAYTYQITFSNTHGDTIPMDVPCIGGVCSGQITLEGWGGGTVTVTVCDGVTSRHLAVAQSLSFSEGSASWHPLTD